jgi:hypothetical protein
MAMDPLLNVYPNASVAGILASPSVTPSYALLSAELSLSTPVLFGQSSTVVGISAKGQLLSASVTFQNAMGPLRATTEGETPALPALTARAQGLVDAFNTLQGTIADLGNLDNLPTGGVTGATDLARSLDAQVLARYTNGDSELTRLTQLGITFQPGLLPGSGSRLSLDTAQLEAAYSDDAAGASALLASAAGTFSEVAGSFIRRSGSQFPSLEALMQTSLGSSLLTGLPQAQSFSLYDLLSSQPPSGSGTNWRQAYAAITEYSVISQLFG